MSEIEKELSWDDQIENDGPEFVILPEGDYDFEITGFERGRYNGGDKLPPCNIATVQIKVEGSEGTTTINHKLFLHSKTEGMLCAFFTAIGQRKKGEKVTMNWNAVAGSTGRCKVGVRKWKNDKGEELIFNEIKKFYEPAEGAPTKKFEAGRF
jgi:hypothetical protein